MQSLVIPFGAFRGELRRGHPGDQGSMVLRMALATGPAAPREESANQVLRFGLCGLGRVRPYVRHT